MSLDLDEGPPPVPRLLPPQGHEEVPSSSLVPANDPTLLFTNAGMNQFKDVFTGQARAGFTRATTSQKCVRAGGKHNDLDNVGPHRAPPHVLRDAGQLLVRRLLQGRRDRVRLGAADQGLRHRSRAGSIYTVHDSDDEARALWKKVAGVGDDRVIRLGDKDNFWAMGETGPCGPCSEIHYHQGDDIPCAEEAAGRHVPGAGLRLRPLGRDLEPGVHAVRAARRAASAARCPARRSTPAWASSGCARCCRACARTTRPTCCAR